MGILITNNAITTLKQANYKECNLNPPALASTYTFVGFSATPMVRKIPGSHKINFLLFKIKCLNKNSEENKDMGKK